jgi:hypothetical protein
MIPEPEEFMKGTEKQWVYNNHSDEECVGWFVPAEDALDCFVGGTAGDSILIVTSKGTWIFAIVGSGQWECFLMSKGDACQFLSQNCSEELKATKWLLSLEHATRL